MIGVIIQARTWSSRYPRKIYEDLSGITTLYRVLEGVTANHMPHTIILAMPNYDEKEFNLYPDRCLNDILCGACSSDYYYKFEKQW